MSNLSKKKTVYEHHSIRRALASPHAQYSTECVRQVTLKGERLGGLGEGLEEHVAFCIHKSVVWRRFFFLLGLVGWLALLCFDFARCFDLGKHHT
jgi:hypothetical protein